MVADSTKIHTAIRLRDLADVPEKLVDAAPRYPDSAKQQRIQGTVIMEAVIDVRGNVSNVRVIESIPALDQAAIDAVEQWRYTPTLINGVPIPALMTVTVSFKLN